MKKREVKVLTTGGTIEKTYSEDDGSMKNRESLIKSKLIKRLRLPHTDIEVEEVMCKDSLDMTEEDRETICRRIQLRAQSGHPIIVLHGTDTLHLTIAHCQAQVPSPTVPILFTGAMMPAGFEDSDAIQNFTEALALSQVVAPGWYVSFHSTLHKGDTIKKDRERRTFVSDL